MLTSTNADGAVVNASLMGKNSIDNLGTFKISQIESTLQDYPKYLKWYSERTPWGKKERLHLAEQREFKEALEKWAERQKMEKKKAAAKS